MRAPAAYWLIIAGMGAVTLLIRLSMILLWGRVSVPGMMARTLRFVPPAVFCALVAPALLRPAGTVHLSPANPYLLAGTLAAVVAWRWKSMLLTIASGMGALWLLR